MVYCISSRLAHEDSWDAAFECTHADARPSLADVIEMVEFNAVHSA